MDGANSIPQKTIYFIRHGQSTFNLVYKGKGSPDPYLFDARLTELGETQANGISSIVLEHLKDIEMVVSSPLTRAMDTTNRAFGELLKGRPELKVKIIKNHSEIVGTSDDTGRNISILKKEFPHFDFSSLDNEERWWHMPDEIQNDLSKDFDEYFKTKPFAESKELVLKRIEVFKQWIYSQKETKIAFIGHSDFFYYFFEKKLPYLKNCQIVQWTPHTNETKYLN